MIKSALKKKVLLSIFILFISFSGLNHSPNLLFFSYSCNVEPFVTLIQPFIYF